MKPRQRRYFAGRAPGNEDRSDDDSHSSGASDRPRNASSANQRLTSTALASPQSQPPKISKSHDAVTRRRPRIQAKVVSADAGTPVAKNAPATIPSKPLQQLGFVRVVDEEDGSEVDRGARGENVGDGLCSSDCSSSSDDSYSDSGASSNSGSEETPANALARNRSPPRTAPPQAPVFIPRAARGGIGISTGNGKRVKSRSDAEAAERKREAQREEREREARADILSRARESDDVDHDLQRVDMASFPDDTDRPEDKEMEFALWRVRELKRIMRERGMDVDETAAGEERADVKQESPMGENGSNVGGEGGNCGKSDTGRGAYKVGAFFAEKGPDGRYVEELYNREYGEEPESVRRKKGIQPMSAVGNGTERRR